MKNTLRMATMAVAAAVGLLMLSPTAAHASKKGRRNTAIGLGAVAAYGLIKKKPLIAGVAGAGAAYSWIRSNQVDSDRDRDRQRFRERNRRGNARYNGGYNNGYGGYGRDYNDRRGSYSRASRYDNGRRSSGGRGRRCD
jgi:hypothetical protein